MINTQFYFGWSAELQESVGLQRAPMTACQVYTNHPFGNKRCVLSKEVLVCMGKCRYLKSKQIHYFIYSFQITGCDILHSRFSFMSLFFCLIRFLFNLTHFLTKRWSVNLVLSVAIKWGQWPWSLSKPFSVATVYFLFSLRVFTNAKHNLSCLWALEELEKQWRGFISGPLLLICRLLLWPQQKLPANPHLSQLAITKLPLLSQNIFAVCVLLHRNRVVWAWNCTERAKNENLINSCRSKNRIRISK